MWREEVIYYLSEHPKIKTFQWSPSQSYGSTWSFLFTSISLYLIITLSLHLILSFLPTRHRPIPLGPLPAIHSLSMALLSFTIFSGIILSSRAEIRDTQWFWRRNKTPFQWLLCFPLGTRPSGRVFFWSYTFYLSRFLNLLRTFFYLVQHRRLCFRNLFNQCIVVLISFLWLEFSQSNQVLAIMFTTLVSSIIYLYRFWIAVGLPSACFPFVLNCRFFILVFNLACHVGVFLLHFNNGGCNGFRALGFNSFLNSAILLLFLNSYLRHRKFGGVDVGDRDQIGNSIDSKLS